MNVFVTELGGAPFEVFVVFGKAGSDLTAMSEAIGRLASLALRSGIPVEFVVEQLRGIGGRSSIGFGDQRVLGRGCPREAPREQLPPRRLRGVAHVGGEAR